MAFKYSRNAFYPARISLPENFEHFVPTREHPASPIAAYPPQTSPFTMEDEVFLRPQNDTNNSWMESGWSPWKTISSCRSGCLMSSKGLRLAQRNCDSGTCDSGSSKSVQLCIPNEQVGLLFLCFGCFILISFILFVFPRNVQNTNLLHHLLIKYVGSSIGQTFTGEFSRQVILI